MGWINGVIIEGGNLNGAVIGVDTIMPNISSAFGDSYSENFSNTAEGVAENFFNTNFLMEIDISSYFTSAHALYTYETFADIPIKNDNNTIVGYFEIRIAKVSDSPTCEYNVEFNICDQFAQKISSLLHSPATVIFQNAQSYTYYEEPKVYICFAQDEYNNHTIASLYINANQTSHYQGRLYGIQAVAYGNVDMDTLQTNFGISGHIDISDISESPEFGPEAEPGGYVGPGQGSHNKSSDHSGIPTKPQYGFSSAGFLNHYLITSQGLSMLGEALFPEPTGVSVDVAAAVDKLIANMWNSKIIDYVIDCRIIPARPHDDGMHNITCGGKVLVNPGTSAIYRAALIDEDFVDIDCGEITTPLTEGNFLDFYQMSCKLFLPFYGYVDIAPEYWHGATIGVYYRFNMMDGSFMVWVTSKAFNSGLENGDVIAQYSGNACIHLPINSVSYSNIIGGMITTGAAIVGTAAGAGAAVGAAGSAAKALKVSNNYEASMIGQAASGAANIINSRPQLNANNSYNGSGALMSKRKPYLLIEFNNPQFSKSYVDEQGLPLVVTRQIGSVSGMTVCNNAILNFTCTEAEQREILAALQEGVIV